MSVNGKLRSKVKESQIRIAITDVRQRPYDSFGESRADRVRLIIRADEHTLS